MLELLLDNRPLQTAPELQEGQWAELSCLPPADAALTLELANLPLEPFLRPGDPYWRWRWQAPGAAGSYPLRLVARWPDGQRDELHGALQVLPRKLDADRYAALLDDLQRLGRALVFALGGGAEAAALPAEIEPSPPTPAEELGSLFGDELEQLATAVERLARRPPDRLRPGVVAVEPGQARAPELRAAPVWEITPGGNRPAANREFGAGETAATVPPPSGEDLPQGAAAASALPEGAAAPALAPDMQAAQSADPAEPPALPELARSLSGLRSLPERRPQASYDSYEARLLRRLLEALWRRLERLVAGGLPAEQAARAAAARERLRALRNVPFLAGVPPLAQFAGPTPRLQRDAEYRVVYRMWRRLRRRPLISWDAATLSIGVGDLPRLYERWCAVRVALALLELPGWQLAVQNLVADDGETQLLSLPEREPLVELTGPNQQRLSLRYQPRYRPLPAHPRTTGSSTLVSLDRHTRVPDLVVLLERPEAGPRTLVLDAKYRLDASGGVPEDALADAYSYLGSIGTPEGARAVVAVALLYPGRGPAERYLSGAAALPLLPDAESALHSWLTDEIAAL